MSTGPSSSSSFTVLQTGWVGWDGYELTTAECQMNKCTEQNVASWGGNREPTVLAAGEQPLTPLLLRVGHEDPPAAAVVYR